MSNRYKALAMVGLATAVIGIGVTDTLRKSAQSKINSEMEELSQTPIYAEYDSHRKALEFQKSRIDRLPEKEIYLASIECENNPFRDRVSAEIQTYALMNKQLNEFHAKNSRELTRIENEIEANRNNKYGWNVVKHTIPGSLLALGGLAMYIYGASKVLRNNSAYQESRKEN